MALLNAQMSMHVTVTTGNTDGTGASGNIKLPWDWRVTEVSSLNAPQGCPTVLSSHRVTGRVSYFSRCYKVPERNEGGKICFGSQFPRVQSMFAWPQTNITAGVCGRREMLASWPAGSREQARNWLGRHLLYPARTHRP